MIETSGCLESLEVVTLACLATLVTLALSLAGGLGDPDLLARSYWYVAVIL